MNVPSIRYKRHRFPASIIAHAVWLYYRFPLSLRHVEELLLERGIRVSYETIRQWARKFGPEYARRIRRKPPSSQDIWYLDEAAVSINGKRHSGVPSIRMDMFSTKSFKTGATPRLHGGC